MTNIVAWGTYLPRFRLDRAAAGIGKGTRAVASFDEDATSMAVEAARRALAGAPSSPLASLIFSTTAPPYADRTNATAVHQALDLDQSVAAFDALGSVRSTVGALCAAFDAAAAGRMTMVVAGDVRIGLPGSADERDGGDGAAALIVGPGLPARGSLLGRGSASAEFLDRWRVPGDPTSRQWEERFGETHYTQLANAALVEALKDADLTIDQVDHLIVTGLHQRAVNTARRISGARHDAIADDLVGLVGMTGAAHPLLLVADALERTSSGEVIALLVLSDGADCLVLRAGTADPASVATSVSAQLDGPVVSYQDVLVWRGLLRREPPRRPDPDRPAAPPSGRTAAWKFGLVGSRCTECGTRHLPPERICLSCGALDQMQPAHMSDVLGTVSTFAVDHLAFSVAPPVVAAVVDFDGGGRIQCEMTDVDPSEIAIGDRVCMTFRRLYTTADGVHNYFWKARPASERRNRA